MTRKREKRFAVVETRQKAALIAKALIDKQALDVRALDVSGLTSVTDAIVLATARNARHAKALADHLLDEAGKAKLEYLGMEGYRGGEWVLVDLNDVIAHIFLETARGFYNLEGLWADAGAIPLENDSAQDAAQAKEESGG